MNAYNLKQQLENCSLSYSGLSDALKRRQIHISKAAISDLINKQVWPKRLDQRQLKTAIAEIITASGGETKNIWQVTGVPSDLEYALTLMERTMLNEDIQQKCGLFRDPFFNEIDGAGDVIETPGHKRALKKLIHTCERRGFCVLHGIVGAGKSTVKEMLLRYLRSQTKYLISQPFMLDLKCFTTSNLITRLLIDLHWGGEIDLNGQARRFRMDREMRSQVVVKHIEIKSESGLIPVIVIDQAHDLPDDVLTELKVLHETTGPMRKIAIILIGQNEIYINMKNNFGLREVLQRVEFVELDPIPEFLGDYIKFKIERAGGKFAELFDQSAIKALQAIMPRFANPLSINNVASLCLQEAYNVGQFPVTDELVLDLDKNKLAAIMPKADVTIPKAA